MNAYFLPLGGDAAKRQRGLIPETEPPGEMSHFGGTEGYCS